MPDTREIEQLRREVNELRERLVRLECRPAPVPVDLMRFGAAPRWGGLPGQTVGVADCVTPV